MPNVSDDTDTPDAPPFDLEAAIARDRMNLNGRNQRKAEKRHRAHVAAQKEKGEPHEHEEEEDGT